MNTSDSSGWPGARQATAPVPVSSIVPPPPSRAWLPDKGCDQRTVPGAVHALAGAAHASGAERFSGELGGGGAGDEQAAVTAATATTTIPAG